MIGDTVVVDAAVHPYNLAPENQNPDARSTRRSSKTAAARAGGLPADDEFARWRRTGGTRLWGQLRAGALQR
jgi:hypothetical protein